MTSLYHHGPFRVLYNYGYRFHPVTGKYSFHHGIDTVGIDSDQVVSVSNGVVSDVSYIADCFSVSVTAYDGCIISYRGLENASVTVGDILKKGDSVGTEKDIAHTHLEIKHGRYFLNPADYIGIPNSKGIVRPPLFLNIF